jgi:hypothetical protein
MVPEAMAIVDEPLVVVQENVREPSTSGRPRTTCCGQPFSAASVPS